MIATKPPVLSRKAAVVSASVASTSPMTPKEPQAQNKKTRIDDKTNQRNARCPCCKSFALCRRPALAMKGLCDCIVTHKDRTGVGWNGADHGKREILAFRLFGTTTHAILAFLLIFLCNKGECILHADEKALPQIDPHQQIVHVYLSSAESLPFGLGKFDATICYPQFSTPSHLLHVLLFLAFHLIDHISDLFLVG